MTIHEECQDPDCDWEAHWEGGGASEDPGIAHAYMTGHTVSASVGDDDD